MGAKASVQPFEFHIQLLYIHSFPEAHANGKGMVQMKKWIQVIGAFLLFLSLAGVWYTASIYKKSADMLEASHEELERDESPKEQPRRNGKQLHNELPDHFSVLFIGIDDNEHRNQGNARADALVLATYQKDAHSVKLISIPRDSYVYVPKLARNTKIAHAHAFGGVLETVETVEELLDIPIDYYVRFNFHTFVDVVDAIGGVHFDVPYEIIESNSQDQRDQIHLQPGYQLLSGEEALAVVRTRKQDSDVHRGQRQLEMLQAIAEEAASLSTFFKLEELILAVGANLKTNFTLAEIRAGIAANFRNTPKLEFHQLQGTPIYQRGSAIYQIHTDDLQTLQKELQHHLGIPAAR